MPVDGHVIVKGGYWDARMGNHWATCLYANEFKGVPEPDRPALQQLEPGHYQVIEPPAPSLVSTATVLKDWLARKNQHMAQAQGQASPPAERADFGRVPLVQLHIAGSCSKQRGPGGWSCILASAGQTRQLAGRLAQTTLIQATWTALLQGLAALKRECRLEVHTDCKQVIDALQFWSELNREELVCARSGTDRTSQLQKQAVLGLNRHDFETLVPLEGPVWSEHDQLAHDVARAEALAAEKLVIVRSET
ncbi:MAG: ribonuclease HI [Candidatus Sericytochromatia bacterium]